LGIGNTETQTQPCAAQTTGVLNGRKIISVSAGYFFSIALDSKSVIYSWGINSNCELGQSSVFFLFSFRFFLLLNLLFPQEIKQLQKEEYQDLFIHKVFLQIKKSLKLQQEDNSPIV
jgi:alpha-tubulin suppressor-like RCC1 family protein